MLPTVDYSAIQNALDLVFKDNHLQKSRSALILYKGQLIGEKYIDGFGPDTPVLGWSMTKSVIATIYGILEYQGKLNVSDRVAFEDWAKDERAHITLDDFIADIVLKENIDCFVVGDPKNLDGTNTDSTAHVSGFVKRLQKLYPTTLVHQIDERFTSKIAKQSILASGVKKKSRQNKALVDKVSATIILQNYLDYR